MRTIVLAQTIASMLSQERCRASLDVMHCNDLYLASEIW